MARNQSQARFGAHKLHAPYTDYPLGQKLASSGISVATVIRLAGVPKAAVSNFIRGRYDRSGRANNSRIRKALTQLGIISLRPRKPPVCRQCGIEYPTRKHGPIEFKPKSTQTSEDNQR